MINNDHSRNMNEWTEIPGHSFPVEAHYIIKHRFDNVREHCRDKKVLEVGSGSGMGLYYLSQIAEKVIGLEYSAENVEVASQLYPNLEVIQGDAHEMPFEDDSFDVIIAMAMVYYLDFDKFIQEVKRVLKPGGLLFFCTSNKMVPGFVAAQHTQGYYTVPELDEKLTSLGFDVNFSGAFPDSRSPYVIRYLRGVIKNLVKFIFQTNPLGRSIWQKLRSKKQGDVAVLPRDIGTINIPFEIECVKISSKGVNNIHRIIYCSATL